MAVAVGLSAGVVEAAHGDSRVVPALWGPMGRWWRLFVMSAAAGNG